MVEYDPIWHKTMGWFAIGLGLECLVFIILQIPDVESWMYGVIAIQAIIFGALAMSPPTLFYTVKVKEQKLTEMDVALKELQEKAVLVEKKDDKKPADRIDELIQEIFTENYGER